MKQRMHQPEFRSRVLSAYALRCAVCELRKAPLLDAAHITSDTDGDGLPIVTNGLALCKIHLADRRRCERWTTRATFLSAGEVMARYGWGKTKGYQNLKDRGLCRRR